jgi:hypothetical protein
MRKISVAVLLTFVSMGQAFAGGGSPGQLSCSFSQSAEARSLESLMFAVSIGEGIASDGSAYYKRYIKGDRSPEVTNFIDKHLVRTALTNEWNASPHLQEYLMGCQASNSIKNGADGINGRDGSTEPTFHGLPGRVAPSFASDASGSSTHAAAAGRE